LSAEYRGIEIRAVRANGDLLTQNHPTKVDHQTRSIIWSCCVGKICWTILWKPWNYRPCWAWKPNLELASRQL